MSQKERYLIVIGGPTAVGKTELCIDLATKLDCPILSADSRQFYRELNIGTAKPSAQQLSVAKHYFINSLSVADEYSMGQFERDALEVLDEVYKNKNIAILTGGTGLYLKAVYSGLDQFPKVNPESRSNYQNLFQDEGIGKLQKLLKDKDPVYAGMVDLQNPHRLIRALCVIDSTGRPFSSFLTRSPSIRSFTVLKISLERDRSELYERINHRVDIMIEDGLVQEVQALQKYRHHNALNTLGYKEIMDYLDGNLTLEEAIMKIKQHSRNFAKRQMTWFRNQGKWIQFHPEDKTGIARHISKSTGIVAL